MNIQKPSGWEISHKDSWVSFEELKDNGAPALEGRDVVGYIEFAAGQFVPDSVKQMAAGKPNYTFTNPQTRKTYTKKNGHWTVSGQDGKEVQKRMAASIDRGNVPRQHVDEPKPKPKPKPKPEPKPESNPPVEKQKNKKREVIDSLNISGQAHSQRANFLEERGRNPEMYIDTRQVGRGKERTSIRNYIEKVLSNDPKLKKVATDVVEFMSLWVDGDGKRISGDTIKEGKTSQDVKQFSLEYKLNNDGSVSQVDPSAEGEQRAFRNFNELNSILNGPIKKALLAAGLTEEDLTEHPPQKPNLTGLSKEQKEIIKKEYQEKLDDYNTRERKRQAVAENLPQEVMQEYLQESERKTFGSPLDSFKDLSPEEQDKIVDTIYPLLPPTLKGRFDKVGSPRKNIFGGYEVKDGKKVPVYADKITPIRGKGMLKKYLIQGGIDGYTHDQTIMSPFSLTLDHVLPSAKGGGDHPDNGVFTRGGLNTHLSDNSFLWLYRSALGEKERLNQLSENPEEQKKLYNEAQSSAYKSQFGTSVALSQAGTGKKLSEGAIRNSRGNLTGSLNKDLNFISSNISQDVLAEANAGSLDPGSKEVKEFTKKQTLKLTGIAYFGTLHPNAPAPSEKTMSSAIQSLLWEGISSKLKQGSSINEINQSVADIKNLLAASMLSGTVAGNRYLSKIDLDPETPPEKIFQTGIKLASEFLGRSLTNEEILSIKGQF